MKEGNNAMPSDLNLDNLDDDMLDIDLDNGGSDHPTPTLEETVEALKASDGELPDPMILYGLSDLTEAQFAQIKPVWESFDATYQHIFMQMLVDAVDANFELDYTVFATANLRSPHADVRKAAIEVLAESEDVAVMDHLIEMVRNDPSDAVRSEAMTGLARFVLMGELGDIPVSVGQRAQDQALLVLHNSRETALLRGRALEALANCGHKDVNKAITEAYRSNDEQLRYSAVVAMGRSCDERWSDAVLQEIESEDADVRRAAARAAGELQISEAVPLLAPLLSDAPRDLQEIVVWSLGEIGGREALRLLNALSDVAEENDDEHMLLLIDEALGNASLSEGHMMLFDIDPEE